MFIMKQVKIDFDIFEIDLSRLDEEWRLAENSVLACSRCFNFCGDLLI
jgi:hypothetical protein